MVCIIFDTWGLHDPVWYSENMDLTPGEKKKSLEMQSGADVMCMAKNMKFWCNDDWAMQKTILKRRLYHIWHAF